jgi:ATP-dependent RNA helicase DDX47/RRP3
MQGFSLKSLKHLVLDEADKLLDMDFEVEIDQILKVIASQIRESLKRAMNFIKTFDDL